MATRSIPPPPGVSEMSADLLCIKKECIGTIAGENTSSEATKCTYY